MRTLFANGLLAVSYFCTALLGQWDLLVPDYASAVWPPAGVALAGLLILGPTRWPGVWLGALGANLYRVGMTLGGQWLTTGVLMQSAAIAAGSTLGAWLGVWLIQRFIGSERIFHSGRTILTTLLFGGPAGTLVSALIGPAVLVFNGVVTKENLPFNIFTWWLGDTLGVLVTTPLLLLWSPALEPSWRRLRWLLGSGLLLVLMAAVMSMVYINRLEHQRTRILLDQEATRFTDELQTTFQVVEELLYSVAGYLRLHPQIDAENFDRFTLGILERNPGIMALEWIPRVSAKERAQWEEWAGRWFPGFTITERADSGQMITAGERESYFPVVLVEPLQGNEKAIGFDIGSDIMRLAAIEAARDSGRPTATAGIQLVQDRVKSIGVLLLVPVYHPAMIPATIEERRTALVGFALGVLRIAKLVETTLARWKDGKLSIEIIDPDEKQADNPLYRSAGRPEVVRYDSEQTLRVADRNWRLHYRFGSEHPAFATSFRTWLLLVGGLLLTALLEAFVLLIISRDILTRNLVRQRTTELELANAALNEQIAERQRAEASLVLAQKVIENTNEAIVITNDQGKITFVNRAYEQVTGWSNEEVLGKSSNITKSGRHDHAFYEAMWHSLREHGFWAGEIWDRRKNGEIFPKWLSISAIRDATGRALYYVGLFTDITQKKYVEKELEQLAYFDPLTGLPNRFLFRERLEQGIRSAGRHQSGVALFYIDLDRFKLVNDTMGHAAGDELLKIVASRLQTQVRRTDTVARLGGDEFTVILTDVTHPAQISPFAQEMIDSLNTPLTILGQEVQIGGSIGIALFPGDGNDFDTLTKHADMAMYLAKEKGRNNFQFFSDDLQTRIVERINMENDLKQSIKNQEFVLHYQPKFNAQTRRVVGMESLVRWEKPGQGLISPAKFMPLAEETGLILPMGEWILEQSCRQTADWHRGEACFLQVAVNLSARQFQQPNLIEMVRNTLEKTGLPPDCLELEITESMLMGNVAESVAIMRRLRDLGISLAMDDFGTGYSSLGYLKRFPVDTLKIDQAFVRELQENSSDASIVKAVIGLAKALNLKVVAEGVENANQLEFLRTNGCDLIQGYYLAKPMPAAAFANFAGLVEPTI